MLAKHLEGLNQLYELECMGNLRNASLIFLFLFQPVTLYDPSVSAEMKRLLSIALSVEPKQRKSLRKD